MTSFLSALSLQVGGRARLIRHLGGCGENIVRRVFRAGAVFSSRRCALIRLNGRYQFFSKKAPRSKGPRFCNNAVPFVHSNRIRGAAARLALARSKLGGSSTGVIRIKSLVVTLCKTADNRISVSGVSNTVGRTVLYVHPGAVGERCLGFLFRYGGRSVLGACLRNNRKGLSNRVVGGLYIRVPFPSRRRRAISCLITFRGGVNLRRLGVRRLVDVQEKLLRRLFVWVTITSGLFYGLRKILAWQGGHRSLCQFIGESLRYFFIFWSSMRARLSLRLYLGFIAKHLVLHYVFSG